MSVADYLDNLAETEALEKADAFRSALRKLFEVHGYIPYKIGGNYFTEDQLLQQMGNDHYTKMTESERKRLDMLAESAVRSAMES